MSYGDAPRGDGLPEIKSNSITKADLEKQSNLNFLIHKVSLM